MRPFVPRWITITLGSANRFLYCVTTLMASPNWRLFVASTAIPATVAKSAARAPSMTESPIPSPLAGGTGRVVVVVVGFLPRYVGADCGLADRSLDIAERQLGRAERQREAYDEHRPAREANREESDPEPVKVEAGTGDAIDRVVPEIEAVRAQTDPPHGLAAEGPARVGGRMYGGGDDEQGCDVNEQEAAV